MNTKWIIAAGTTLALAGCGSTEGSDTAADEPLSQLEINSAKRQCTSVAVMQQVPSDAAKGVCDCTIEKLIEDGAFTASTNPTDAQQQAALDVCIDSALEAG
ncbi:MAG: hypothetical protein AAF687_02925 [Pseudomonadota bacterium]